MATASRPWPPSHSIPAQRRPWRFPRKGSRGAGRIVRARNERFPTDLIHVSTKVDTYQLPRADQRSAPTNSSGNLSKAGWVRLRGRERHGWRDRAYMDVFTASPATGPAPLTLRKPASAVASAVAVASAGAGRSPAKEPLPYGHCISPLATFALNSSSASALAVSAKRKPWCRANCSSTQRTIPHGPDTCVDQGRHLPTAACRPTVSTHQQQREPVEGGVGPVAGA